VAGKALTLTGHTSSVSSEIARLLLVISLEASPVSRADACGICWEALASHHAMSRVASHGPWRPRASHHCRAASETAKSNRPSKSTFGDRAHRCRFRLTFAAATTTVGIETGRARVASDEECSSHSASLVAPFGYARYAHGIPSTQPSALLGRMLSAELRISCPQRARIV